MLFKTQAQCYVFPFTLDFLIVLRLIKDQSQVYKELPWLSPETLRVQVIQVC